MLVALGPAVPSAAAQNSNSNDNTNQSPSASPVPASTPISVSAIVSEAESVTSRLRAVRNELVERAKIREIDESLPELE